MGLFLTSPHSGRRRCVTIATVFHRLTGFTLLGARADRRVARRAAAAERKAHGCGRTCRLPDCTGLRLRCAAFAPRLRRVWRCAAFGAAFAPRLRRVCAADRSAAPPTVAQWHTEYTVDTHCKRSSVGVERTCRRAAAERSGADRIAVVAAVLQAQSPFSLRPPRYIAEEEEWEALPHSHHKLSGPPFIPT